MLDCKTHLETGGSLLELESRRDAQGGSLLHVAAANGYAPVVKYLLELGFRTDIADNDGYYATHAAVAWQEVLYMILLLRNVI